MVISCWFCWMVWPTRDGGAACFLPFYQGRLTSSSHLGQFLLPFVLYKSFRKVGKGRGKGQVELRTPRLLMSGSSKLGSKSMGADVDTRVARRSSGMWVPSRRSAGIFAGAPSPACESKHVQGERRALNRFLGPWFQMGPFLFRLFMSLPCL